MKKLLLLFLLTAGTFSCQQDKPALKKQPLFDQEAHIKVIDSLMWMLSQESYGSGMNHETPIQIKVYNYKHWESKLFTFQLPSELYNFLYELKNSHQKSTIDIVYPRSLEHRNANTVSLHHHRQFME